MKANSVALRYRLEFLGDVNVFCGKRFVSCLNGDRSGSVPFERGVFVKCDLALGETWFAFGGLGNLIILELAAQRNVDLVLNGVV